MVSVSFHHKSSIYKNPKRRIRAEISVRSKIGIEVQAQKQTGNIIFQLFYKPVRIYARHTQ